MAKYIKQEIPDLHGTGETKCYYRLQKSRNLSTKEFLEYIGKHGLMDDGVLKHALGKIADGLAEQLAEGYTVTLDGIGTFSATIGVKEGKEQDTFYGEEVKRNAKSLEVKNVTFRSDKELVKEVNRRCDLKRAGVFQIHRSKYNKEERLKLALNYLSSHSVMRIQDYVELTGLSRTSATLELKEFRENPESGITFSGRGTTKVYIKRG